MKPTPVTVPGVEIANGITALVGLSQIRVKGYTMHVGMSLHNCRNVLKPIQESITTAQEKFKRKDADGNVILQCDNPLKFDMYRGHFKSDSLYFCNDIVYRDSIYYESRVDMNDSEPTQGADKWRIYGQAQQIPYYTDFLAMQEEIREIEQQKVTVDLYLIPVRVFEDQLEKIEGYTPSMFWHHLVEWPVTEEPEKEPEEQTA